ncbi:MAG: hypothetical protein JWQ27_2071 [Ferruginibacter sp.]|nr:hypothetical protein [Ferruginibacter sp.]
MRFFAKLVFLCNCCFIIAAILRVVEMRNSAKGNSNLALKFQPLESTVVILGYGAILINLVFVLMVLYRMAFKRTTGIPRNLLWFNLLMFPVQVYYLFFT